MLKTFKIQVGGQVQGVGFRPFVFNLAQKHQLKGTVSNNANGVLIYVNGTKEELMNFMEDILEKAPDAAIIQGHSMDEIEPREFENFSIVPSQKTAKVAIPLTADFAICNSCKKEIQDPSNRRYRYAFTTCTQCGPRYAITQKFPFERALTTMGQFTMCESCVIEYKNPKDSRFHSQTNSCIDCGIKMKLLANSGEPISVENEREILSTVARFLKEGAIVALKNTSGYLLCADATNPEVVKKLRERKQRPTKPFALLYPNMEKIREAFHVSNHEQRALESRVCPIVLLDAKQQTKGHLAEGVAPGLDRYGVMLPSSALLTLLAIETQTPLVATSGNIHGSPILSSEKEAREKLSTVADYFLNHNLEIVFPQDDSVMHFADKQRILLRRSRGLAPNLMGYTPKPSEKVLAMGAHLKSTLAFTPNGHTYLSPYFGNLDSYEVLQRYTDTLQRYTQLFEELPEVVLVDKHPAYQSTILGKELATNWKVTVVEVQHHKAHFAGVLAEHDLFEIKKPVLGVIWDGTGLGDDGMIWGGEFFVYQNHQIELKAHFEYFDTLAGDKMAKEPRLSLFSLVNSEAEVEDKFSKAEIKIYQKLKENSKLGTSSVGRLFDAVASLLDVLDVSTYEGEAALLLENLAWQYPGECIDLLEGKSFGNVPSKAIMERLIALKHKGESKAKLAASFIYTLARVVVKMAITFKISTIACSGGVFQNRLLVQTLMGMAEEDDISFLFHKEMSSNDENIALGQLAYYQNIKE
ncbi:carbamoyltransferase HypF [Flagellimonas meridianipacifica]|uniref:Carbamoyltransferase n=1 Tax=Flagellimonas meridianipacifica TaxID=1080225 RepID=A0A2T0MIV0_9FLAO|nr:carbamoyltransferase HypF [Allomuricauda pacifica]PRX57483.1 hydrogenase maturation protein HypF [Allomuricauda pacifica]